MNSVKYRTDNTTSLDAKMSKLLRNDYKELTSLQESDSFWHFFRMFRAIEEYIAYFFRTFFVNTTGRNKENLGYFITFKFEPSY